MAFLGRKGELEKDGSTIANCQSISASASADAIKEYVQGGSDPDKPEVLESGNKTFEFSVEHIYVDNGDFVDEVLGGTKLTITVYPNGNSSGEPKITLSNVVLLDWELGKGDLRGGKVNFSTDLWRFQRRLEVRGTSG